MKSIITNEGTMSSNAHISMEVRGRGEADKQVPLWKKHLLTIKEASLYFNIGENKLYRIAAEYLESDYKVVIRNAREEMNRTKNQAI